jgi:DNA-binding NarL/FixJ family response regulator
MPEDSPTRLLVVDDHLVVRRGLMAMLADEPGLVVVAQAGSGEEALQLIETASPNVVLMDLRMPGMGGVAAIQAIHDKRPETSVLVLTNYLDGAEVEAALQAGAIGYLLKDVEIDELVAAVRLARRRMPVLAGPAIEVLVQTRVKPPSALGDELSTRERQVLALLAQGSTNQAIAEQLAISLATVSFHLRGIRKKLHTVSRTEIVSIAVQHRLIPEERALTMHA